MKLSSHDNGAACTGWLGKRREKHAGSKKFNEKVILSTVTFDNVSKDDKNIYTVKIKAKKDVETVYIYQVSADNSFREIAVKQIDGYYEFKVDNISDTFVLTRDVKPIPVWVWEMAGLVTIGGASFALNMFRKRKKSLATNMEVIDENTVEVSLETATESEKQI